MRVIAGKYRGRPLSGPKKEGLRPTADRVKEALFNIIGSRITDADLLDLFAGTGAIGIEALSRNAKTVVFADANLASIKILQQNLTILDAGEQFRVIHLPAERTIELLSKEGQSFDLIFLDPPFQAGLLPKTISHILARHLLRGDGILIIEHPRKIIIEENPSYAIIFNRYYGDIGLTFIKTEMTDQS